MRLNVQIEKEMPVSAVETSVFSRQQQILDETGTLQVESNQIMPKLQQQQKYASRLLNAVLNICKSYSYM